MFKYKGALLLLLLTTVGCSSSMDPSTALGKRGILDQTNVALSSEDCTKAITLIRPVYESKNTDNDVRMMMASAYGCEASINTFSLLDSLVQNASSFTGSGFWEYLAREFPSTTSDRIVEAGQLGQDAVHSAIKPGSVILSSAMYNADTYNPATYNVNDRTSNSNAYLFFLTLATMGGIESRYGNPYANGKRGVATLPWATYADINSAGNAQQASGCAYASAMVNFVDSLGGLSAATTGSLSTTFSTLQSTFQTGIYAACDQGCTLCGFSCPTCPDELRNRSACTGVNTDTSTCAALGIMQFIQTPTVGWDQGP